MSFQVTTALKRIYKLSQTKGKRKFIVQGGSSASKTWSIIPILIDDAIRNNGKEISIVSESVPHLRRGAVKDFIKILMLTGRFDENRWNKTTLTYRFTNGSFIEFFSADSADKLRGGRRTDLYLNEANNIGLEAYIQLAMRTSGKIYIDFNPSERFWAHTEVSNEPDAISIVLTYKDNEALSEAIVNELESKRIKAKTSKYWANWCKVYLDGEIGSLEGACIPDWTKIDTVPSEAKLIAGGLDFGYTNDPSCCVLIYSYNGTYIFDEVFYATKMRNDDIIKEIKKLNLPSDVYIYADHASPKDIADLKYARLKVEPCIKGEIVFGIEKLNQQSISVTASSTNLIKELASYIWKKDKEGNTLNKPTGDDHGIDAMRYGLVTHLDNPSKGKYFIY